MGGCHRKIRGDQDRGAIALLADPDLGQRWEGAGCWLPFRAIFIQTLRRCSRG
jgi:hypothetical protein